MEFIVSKTASVVVSIRPFDHNKILSNDASRKDKFRMITTRIDWEVFRSVKTRLNSKSMIVIGVGSLIDVKRPDRFLNWVEVLLGDGLDVVAKWIGDGPLLEDMKSKSQSRNLNVQFFGHLNRSDIEDHLREASLLFLTSEFEVFPFAVIEAYSKGVPVVSSCFDGVGDFLIDNVTGIIVDGDDLLDVKNRIVDLLNDKKRLRKISVNAIEYYLNNYKGSEVMAIEYNEIYRSFVDCFGEN